MNPQGEKLPSLSESTNPPSPERYPLLVVEDDAAIRTLVARVLRAHGFVVSVAESAERALELVADMEAPLLVVDKNLPGMNGLDLIEQIRATRHDFESVLMTANADVAALVRGVKLGVFRCVLKPFHNDDLVAAVSGASNRLWLRLDLRARKIELEARNAELELTIEKLREADRRRSLADKHESIGRLAAGDAHEINTPLAAVITNLEVLAGELPALRPTADAQLPAEEILADAREGAERVRVIVRDLKMFSRSDEEHIGPVQLTHVLEGALHMVDSEIRHRARVVRDFGTKTSVSGNESRLGQVFLNLLMNAAHAIPDGDAKNLEIRVTTRARGLDQVCIEIRDTGAGIAPDVLRNIFDPFFTTKPIGVGTGLGLSICHGIVTGLGGRIEVESELGAGTVFRVVLRAATSSARQAAPRTAIAPAPITPSPAARTRVLAVDDDALFLGTLRRLLAAHHDVTAVTCASDALVRIGRGEQFDVILCDLMMPDMTGMDLYAELVLSRPDLAERMIFLTGGTFTTRARTFLDEVPNPHLEKPFDAEEVQALIGACTAA
jgi:signal transduction histidine kinase